MRTDSDTMLTTVATDADPTLLSRLEHPLGLSGYLPAQGSHPAPVRLIPVVDDGVDLLGQGLNAARACCLTVISMAPSVKKLLTDTLRMPRVAEG